jgi:hypothetical protein
VLAACTMRQMMFLIGTVFTLLATSLHVDAAAHPSDMEFSIVDQTLDSDDDQEGGTHKGQGGACLAHHHCSNVATPNADPVLEPVRWGAPIFPEGTHRALSSHSENPLLEPPSA